MMPIFPAARARALALLVSALPLLAQAAPDAQKCTYTPLAKLPLRYTGPSLMITTEGTINGTPAVMLVDTGAYKTFFTRTGTERRNMKLKYTGHDAYGIGGASSIYETRITDFSAGPARLTKGFMPVLSDFGFTPTFDAILGAPFLLQTDLEVSLATKEITFFHAGHCAGTYLGYWDDKIIEIPFVSYEGPGTNPNFHVRVNGKELVAMIDTGAGSSSILRDAARRAGIEVDAADTADTRYAAGAGKRKAASWIVTARTFQIGDETVRNAELAMIDSRNHGVDVVLGADFLRAHRVLFAISQKKLYFSYLGGEPFGQRSKLEPWIQAEADSGNADAQLALANAYRSGTLAPRDDARAAAWLEKAATGGSPQAILASGRALMLRGDLAAGATRLRAALDLLPAEREGALWLYIARVRSGQADLAKSELAAIFSRSERGEWPTPIAGFYLGTLGADKLLAQAGEDRVKGANRRCQALAAMAEWHLAHAQPAQSQAVKAQGGAACSATGADAPALDEAWD